MWYTRRAWICDEHQRVNTQFRVFAVEIGPIGHEIAAHCFSAYLSTKLKLLWKKWGEKEKKLGLEAKQKQERNEDCNTDIYLLEIRLNSA